jgi:hypothetical protein
MLRITYRAMLPSGLCAINRARHALRSLSSLSFLSMSRKVAGDWRRFLFFMISLRLG